MGLLPLRFEERGGRLEVIHLRKGDSKCFMIVRACFGYPFCLVV